MRYRPAAGHETGFQAKGNDAHAASLVGTSIPQTRVLDANTNAVRRLDDVLGSGGALVGVGVDQSSWKALDRLLSDQGNEAGEMVADVFAKRVTIAADDRLPRPDNERTSIADLDGALGRYVQPAHGQFLLVRPDRVVAAVFHVRSAQDVLIALAPYSNFQRKTGRESAASAQEKVS